MKHLEYIARVVLTQGKKTLLCRGKKFSWYYFPGGHIEFGESSVEAIRREMREETGIAISNIKYVGMVENIFSEQGKKHHEINLVFAAQCRNKNIISKEAHLEFSWVENKDLARTAILPKRMKQSVIKWMRDKKIFWDTNV